LQGSYLVKERLAARFMAVKVPALSIEDPRELRRTEERRYEKALSDA
jgi:hypothetical protein